jgi:catechol 2,3-dioxygenase-like lactoylglutathione lyase family enzyme
MLAYVTIGSNDLERAIAFYDAILGELGAKRVSTGDRMVLWGAGRGQPMVGVCTPFDGKPATVGNGMMPALQAESSDVVDAVHAKALELGAPDEGAPGPRAGGALYVGYFRDPDGNKLAVVSRG